MGDVFIWRLFNQVAITPAVWGEKGDASLVARTLETDVPHVLDYLEAELPADGYRFGLLSIADISIATFFRNAGFARFAIDAARWPRTAAFVDRVLANAAVPEAREARRPPDPHPDRPTPSGVGRSRRAPHAGNPRDSTPRRGLMPI